MQQMQESQENLEPMAITDSAFSRRAKQEMVKLGVPEKDVNLGTVPKNLIAS